MKNATAWLLLGLLSLGNAAWSHAEEANAAAEKAVAALEHKWLESERTNNPDLIAPHLADRFVNTGMDGKVADKAGTLASAKATKYTSVDYENIKITVFGDTAIATGLFRAKGSDASGKPIDAAAQYTDTWVRMPDGAWQCVASHSSNIPM